ncbi:MAG: hypothetical protein ACRD1E_05335 [Terriglobales bacterium]
MRTAAASVALFVLLGCAARSQQAPDAGILAAVRALRAVDDHAHPPALPLHGVADTDYDALPCPPGDPTPPWLAISDNNSVIALAWKALFGAD